MSTQARGPNHLQVGRGAVLTVDLFEPHAIHRHLTDEGVDFAVQAMPAGDYVIASSTGVLVGVERKEYKDFLASIATRVDGQMDKCHLAFDYTVLLIEGWWQLDGKLVKGTGWTAAAMWGKLASLQLEYPRLMIQTTPNLKGTAAMISWLMKRAELLSPKD